MNNNDQIERVDKDEVAGGIVNADSPEPPERYRDDLRRTGFPGDSRRPAVMRSVSDCESVRKLTSAAKIMAIASLLIGGVLLSSAAVVTSVVAYRKASRMLEPSDRVDSLKRSARVCVVVGMLALALNAIALAYIAPIIAEAMRAGDYSSLFGPPQQTTPSTGSSFWG